MTLLILLGIVGVVDLAILLKLQYAFRLLRMPTDTKVDEKDLPTVTICIPARNETHAMTQCLERVVATEYPKLEVIVLDDGSRDDTSLLIKSFAHAGVRFIEGKPLPEGWLGKNYAQYILAKEASGDFVFFMDVDTLVERHTLMRLIEYMMRYKTKMLSIVPIRDDDWQTSTLMTTMRHFWTLMRFMPGRPRAASNACLVDRELLLEQFATDTNLQTSVQMETAIARNVERGSYRLVMSNTWLGLRYEKKWSSQVETSIRLLYPQCDMFLLQAVFLVAILAMTLVPYAVFWFEPAAIGVIAVQFAVAYYYLSHVWVRYRFVGALLAPITIAQEIILIIMSVYNYKRGTVTWKGRPVQVQASALVSKSTSN